MTFTYFPASSGMISGVGFAIAKTMASRCIAPRSSTFTTPGSAQADEPVGSDHRLAPRPAEALRVGVLREPRLHRVHVLGPAAVERAGPVAGDDVAGALQHQELGGGDRARPRAGEDDLHLAELLVDDLQRGG